MENIRDRGKSERQARQIQSLIADIGRIAVPAPLPIIERPDGAQLRYTGHYDEHPEA